MEIRLGTYEYYSVKELEKRKVMRESVQGNKKSKVAQEKST